MTSANFFNGYACDKTTSRVLAPPGGRSSNIFGYDEPVAAAPQRTNGAPTANNAQRVDASPQLSAQQQAHANKMHQNGGFNLFDDGSSVGQHDNGNSITQSHRGHGIKPKDDSYNDIFGAQNGAAKPVDRQKSTVFEERPAPQAARGQQSNKPRSGYNTITGQTYEEEQVQRENSAKVYVAHQVETAAETKSNGLHTSSRVLQPPGGRSTGLW